MAGDTQATISPDILDASLARRASGERAALTAAFFGVTTWQHVCTTLSLDYSAWSGPPGFSRA